MNAFCAATTPGRAATPATGLAAAASILAIAALALLAGAMGGCDAGPADDVGVKGVAFEPIHEPGAAGTPLEATAPLVSPPASPPQVDETPRVPPAIPVVATSGAAMVRSSAFVGTVSVGGPLAGATMAGPGHVMSFAASGPVAVSGPATATQP